MDIGHLRAFNRFSSIGQWMAILVFLRFLSRISRRMAESNEEREKTNERATQLNAPSDFLLPVQWPFRLVRVTRKILCTNVYGISPLSIDMQTHTHHTRSYRLDKRATNERNEQRTFLSIANFASVLWTNCIIAPFRVSIFLSFFLLRTFIQAVCVCARARFQSGSCDLDENSNMISFSSNYIGMLIK